MIDSMAKLHIYFDHEIWTVFVSATTSILVDVWLLTHIERFGSDHKSTQMMKSESIDKTCQEQKSE